MLGPVLFSIFMMAVMTSWRAKSDQSNCVCLFKHDEVLKGRKHNAHRDKYTVDASEDAEDTAALFVSREVLEK